MTNRPIRILIGGDWILKTPWHLQPRAARTRAASLLNRMTESDLTLVNLEGMPLSTKGERVPKSPVTVSLHLDPLIAHDLKRFGISAVSVANNHAMDYGPEALLDTISTVESLGIKTFGGGDSLAAALEPLTFESDGVRIGIFGIACTLPPGSAAGPRSAGVAPVRVFSSMEVDHFLLAEQPGSAPRMHTWAVQEDVDRICEVVSQAQKQNTHDVRIVFVHWGVPPAAVSTFLGQDLADYQQPLGRALVDAGADAVVGCHSHSIHGIELYNGKPIVYGLGTMLLTEPPTFISRQALLVQLEVAAGGVVGVQAVPVLKDEDGIPFLPSARDGARIIDELEAKSRSFGTPFDKSSQRVLLQTPRVPA